MLSPWLVRSEITSYIENIADNFEESKLSTFVGSNVDVWLRRLIGSTIIEELRTLLSLQRAYVLNPSLPVVVVTPRQQVYIDLVKPFLCYAGYADFVAVGHIFNTKSGPVTKASNQEVNILDDENRERLRLFYLGKAKQLALELAKFRAAEVVTAPCSTRNGVGNGKPTGTVIRGKNYSTFQGN